MTVRLVPRLLVHLWLAQAVLGMDLFVRVSGNDANSCTDAAPCRTLTRAVGVAAADDRIVIGSGLFRENVTIDKNITIVGEGAPKTIIDGRGAGRTVQILNRAVVAISDVTIQNGRLTGASSASGAGVYVAYACRLTLSFSVVRDNIIEVSNLNSPVFAQGAGIKNDFGELAVSTSEIRGNRATASSASEGGGISSSGQMTVRDSTIADNEAIAGGLKATGGGIYNQGTGEIVNSTISSNRARGAIPSVPGHGGGVGNIGRLTLTHVTITANISQMGDGGGLISSRGLTISNSILAGNLATEATDANDCGGTGPILSRGGNLVGTRDRCPLNAHASDLFGSDSVPVNPSLGGLANVADRLPRFHLPQATSPAIDLGQAAICVIQDARGVVRIPGAACDAGAIESPVSLPAYAPIKVRLARVTQGLEFDSITNTYVQRVARRRTLVRAQFESRRLNRTVTRMDCNIRMLALIFPSPTGWKRTPVERPTVTIPAEMNPAGKPLEAVVSSGWRPDSPSIACWIEPGVVEAPGEYSISMWIQLAGDREPSLTILGTYTFYPASELTLLIQPWVAPPSHPEHTSWNVGIINTLVHGIQGTARRLPVPSGAVLIGLGGQKPATPSGVQYHVRSPYYCADPPNLPSDPVERHKLAREAGRQCEKRYIAAAQAALDRINRAAAEGEKRDGIPRIRFDRAVLLWMVKKSGGGQAEPIGENCIAKPAVDPNGDDGRAGTVIAHEVGHCLGLISTASPHHDGSRHPPGGPLQPGVHTPTWIIPTLWNAEAVNTTTKGDEPGTVSLMHPSPADVGNTQLEVWDWNWLRESRLPGSSFIATASTVVTAPSTSPHPLRRSLLASLCSRFRRRHAFEVLGSVSDTGEFEWHYSQRQRLAPTDVLSATNDTSAYRLVMRGQRGRELSSHGFAVEFPVSAGSANQTRIASVSLLVPTHRQAVRWEIQHGGRVLFSQAITGQKPRIFQLSTAVRGDDLRIDWNAKDSDGPGLRSRLFYRSEGVEHLVATGLPENDWRGDLAFFPSSPKASFRVEVTDGYRSNSSRIQPRPHTTPVRISVSIQCPQAAALVAGKQFALNALVTDGRGGVVTAEKVTWRSSSDGDLGTGGSIMTKLTPGTHSVRATVTAAGAEYQSSISVNVAADSDGDGLPNHYEILHRCLSTGQPDGSDDPDQDGLSNLTEQHLRTNPCAADTDGDGENDQEEVLAGSSPTDASSRPLPEIARPVTDEVVLPPCQTTSSAQVAVGRTSVRITAAADSNWLLPTVSAGADPFVDIHADCSGLPNGIHVSQVAIKADGGRAHAIRVSVEVRRR